MTQRELDEILARVRASWDAMTPEERTAAWDHFDAVSRDDLAAAFTTEPEEPRAPLPHPDRDTAPRPARSTHPRTDHRQAQGDTMRTLARHAGLPANAPLAPQSIPFASGVRCLGARTRVSA
jgi:hypothetical protein